MAEPEDKLTIIPDFFFELIARITPGLLVIALGVYWSGSDFKGVFSNVELSFFVLVGAWIIGITLDAGVFYILKPIRDSFSKKPPCSNNNHNATWEGLVEADAWERGMMNKQRSQMIFFRNMLSVCGLTAIICAIMELSSTLDSLLPVLSSHHKFYGSLAIFLCFVYWRCWKKQSESVEEMNEYLRNRKLVEKPGHKPALNDTSTSSKH